MSDDHTEKDRPPISDVTTTIDASGGFADLHTPDGPASLRVQPIRDPAADSALTLSIAIDGLGLFSATLDEDETADLVDALGDALEVEPFDE